MTDNIPTLDDELETIDEEIQSPPSEYIPPKYDNIYKNELYRQIKDCAGSVSAEIVINRLDQIFVDSNLVRHAQKEFEVLGWPGDDEDDDMQKMICDNLVELLGTLASQGHSVMSAPYVINLFSKLAKYEVISPLTGEDDEWTDVGWIYQNNRCGNVFKDKESGEAWDGKGKIFREPNGCCFTSKGSHVPVVFPYTPKREYVDVPFDRDNVDNNENPDKS